MISRIRASSHNLGIELGRHTRPNPTPIENRICLHCSSNSLDDEFHFIMKCDKNKNERKLLFSKLTPEIINLDQDELFIYLFSNSIDLHIKAFGKFLVDSFAIRQPPEN